MASSTRVHVAEGNTSADLLVTLWLEALLMGRTFLLDCAPLGDRDCALSVLEYLCVIKNTYGNQFMKRVILAQSLGGFSS